jgi:predicted RNA-binding protein with RPS1 domain
MDKIFDCKIIKILPTYVIVSTTIGVGLCHISQVANKHIHDIKQYFKLNQIYKMKLISEPNSDKLKFSYKLMNNPPTVKKRNKIVPTVGGFKQLFEKTNNLLK